MANMNFGVNILPKANNTYTLGNSDYKWNIFANTLNGQSILSDVQINSTSIVNNGIATIPIATANDYSGYRLIQINAGNGINIASDNCLSIVRAIESDAKAGNNAYKVCTPYWQHYYTFYGLAKAAGDSTQSASSNAVGTYTDSAKTAIQNMLAVAPTANPVFTGSISLGRDANSTAGYNSVALGHSNVALGSCSIAMGMYNYANADASIALGYNNMAMGVMSFAGGYSTRAHGAFSYTFGLNTANDIPSYTNWTASTSYAVGDNVVNPEDNLMYTCIEANSDATFNYSKWAPIVKSTFIEKIGNGEFNIRTGALGNPSNARALDWNGNEYLNGDLYVRCNADSTGGTKVAMISEVPVIDDTAFYGDTDKIFSADKSVKHSAQTEWIRGKICSINSITAVSTTAGQKLDIANDTVISDSDYSLKIFEVTPGALILVSGGGVCQVAYLTSSSTPSDQNITGYPCETTGYIGSVPVTATYMAISYNSTIYNNIWIFQGISTLPTKTSDITNDSNFVSASFADGGLVLTTGTLFAEEVNF